MNKDKILTLKNVTKSSIWELQENDVFRLWEAADRRRTEYTQNSGQDMLSHPLPPPKKTGFHTLYAQTKRGIPRQRPPDKRAVSPIRCQWVIIILPILSRNGCACF